MTTVLFVFPPVEEVTGNNMNYCIVAFGIILLIATLQWVFDGRKNYTGPNIDTEALIQGQVEGITGAYVPSTEESESEPHKSG